MIKLIASDMDGTLLDNTQSVSKNNIAAINRANQLGIQFVVATGRSITEATPLVKNLKEDPDFITINGAQVFNNKLEEVVKIPLDRDVVKECSNTLIQNNIYFELITDHGIYSKDRATKMGLYVDIFKKLNPSTLYKTALSWATNRAKIIHIKFVDSFEPIINDPKIDVLKILAISPKGATAFNDVRNAFSKFDNISITSSAPDNIEINNIDAQKGTALYRFAKKQGISMDEVMAIGDNLNDESMIDAAGIGVAMENAVDHIKDIAQYHTDTNLNDGVAKAIDYAIKLNQFK